MERTVLTRVIVSIVVLSVCALTAASLATYDKNDLAAYRLPPTRPAANACGVVGAHAAEFLRGGLGIGAGLVLLMAAVWSVLNLLGRGSEKIVVRAAGALVLVACACAFAHVACPDVRGLPGSGGSVGWAVNGLLRHYFGSAGRWALSIGVTLFALIMLSVDEIVVPPVLRLASLGGTVVGGLVALGGTVIRRRGRVGLPASRAAAPRPRPAPAPAPGPASDTSEAPTTAEDPLDAVAAAQEAEERDSPADTQGVLLDAAPGPADVREADTGRPVTVGYLDHIQQQGRWQGDDDADEAPTEENEPSDAVPIAHRVPGGAQAYILPAVDLLDPAEPVDHSTRGEHIQEQIEVLERTLGEFGIGATVVDIERGPVVTRYELTLEAGIKLSRVTSLSDDLAIATKAPAVRIVAPIPGKSTIGIELPNIDTEIVHLRELLESDAATARQRVLPIFLGKDASGSPIVGDLTRMPHLLIAGATGSGKSVCINSIIASVLYSQHPDDVRLILIDPKVVELSAYADLPHLLTPVVTDMKRAAWILDWACKTMDERYDTLARAGVRSIAAYNRLGEDGIRARLGENVDLELVPVHLPYIVIIVDELADMMMLASKNIEGSITRLAQKSRAVGLHIVLATQRPSVDVITGLIKSNLPTRISFQVTSKVDSRTILDRNGADKLLGCGDMLFLPPGTANLIRAQGTFISDDEINRVVGFIKAQREPEFTLELDDIPTGEDGDATDGGVGTPEGFGDDDAYAEACRIVLASRRGSVSLLQRKLEIGYTRAARLIDMMAADGIVGGYKGSKAREVVLSLDEWEARRRGAQPPPPTLDEPPVPIPEDALDVDLLQECLRLEDVDDEDEDDGFGAE